MTEIPAHLLKRSQAAKSAADGGAGAPAAVSVSDDDGQTIPRSLLEQSQQSGTSCLLYTSPSPRDGLLSRMPSSA